MRREVRTAIETQHRDDAPGDERLHDLRVRVPLRAVPPGCEPGVVTENRRLEPTNRVAGLQAKLVERGPVRVVDAQRIRLPTCSVQCAHQELAGSLPQQVLSDERLELGHDLADPTELDVGRDSLLDGDQAQLLEAPCLCLRPPFERKLRQWRPAPEVERPHEERPALLRRRCPRILEQPLEAPRVDLVRRDRNDVPRRARDEDVRPQGLPERHDGVLERRRRRLRGLGAVELVDELLRRHDAARP